MAGERARRDPAVDATDGVLNEDPQRLHSEKRHYRGLPQRDTLHGVDGQMQQSRDQESHLDPDVSNEQQQDLGLGRNAVCQGEA